MAKDPNLPNKILIVDNDQAVVNTVANICAKYEITVVSALNWENAMFQFNQHKFDVAIVQLNLEHMAGPVLLNKWRIHDVVSKRECVFILSIGAPQTPEENNVATELGDTTWVFKPIKAPNLVSLLGKVMVAKSQREQITKVRDKLVKPLLDKNDVAGVQAIANEKLPGMGIRGRELAGEVLELVKDLPGALDQFTQLHDLQPLNMRYVNEMGRLNLLMGNLEKAQKAFEEADQIAPNNVERLKNMAMMYLQMQNPDKCVEKFKHAMSIDPSLKEERFDMFDSLQAAGYDKHAMELCQATTEPLELIRHYNNKGVLFSKSEDYVAAINEYQKARKLIPGSKQLYRILYNEGLAHINLKKPEHLEKAKEVLRECLKLNPKFDKAIEKLANLEKRTAPKAAS